MERPREIAQLTSLRFFAALLVLWAHMFFLRESENETLRLLANTIFKEGGAGVSIFFTLSGFVLAYSYRDRVQSGDTSTFSFILRRCLRIYPLHLVVFLAFVFANLLTRPGYVLDHWETMGLNMVLLHAWSLKRDTYFSLNIPSWSISVEIALYCAYCFLVRLKRTELLLLHATLLTLLIGIAICDFELGAQSVLAPIREWFFYINPFVRLIDFMNGILLFLFFQSPKALVISGTFVECASLVVLLLQMFLSRYLTLPDAFRWQLQYMIPSCALVLSLAHGRGALSDLLRKPVLVYFGRASFCLYLTQWPVIWLLERATRVGYLTTFVKFKEPDIWRFVGYTAVCLVIASVAYVTADQRMKNFFRNFRN